MGIWSKLQQAKLKMQRSSHKASGQTPAGSATGMRGKILDQLESEIKADAGGKIFPFRKVTVLLHAPTKTLRDSFQSNFLRDGSLIEDMFRRLKASNAHYSNELEIVVEFDSEAASNQSASSPHPAFKMSFSKPEIPG